MNVSVTNVPGPPQPVFLAGAPLLEVVPVVPIGVNLTFGVGALSYAGQFTVIAVADRDACPDVEAFATACAPRFWHSPGRCPLSRSENPSELSRRRPSLAPPHTGRPRDRRRVRRSASRPQRATTRSARRHHWRQPIRGSPG